MDEQLAAAKCPGGLAGNSKQMTLRERLGFRRTSLQSELSAIDAAISFLDQNENFEVGLNLIGKVGHIGY